MPVVKGNLVEHQFYYQMRGFYRIDAFKQLLLCRARGLRQTNAGDLQ